MTQAFSPKQMEFILNSFSHWNLAHGAVRTGKTICTLFRFMQAASECPDSKIFIVGHTFDTAYRNIVRLLMESEELSYFRPFCSWSGKKLYFRDKTITVLGAKDEGAIGNFQGDTYSLVYCDEITLYPQSIIEMINSRLSKSHSKGFAAMNPKHPTHIVKQWIDKSLMGDSKYYSLHFKIDDNPYIDEDYKQSLRDCNSSLFYKRNYLGLWCVAEGAIFDFFDRDIYVLNRPNRCADYWIAGIDYGTRNSFCCLLIGVSTGIKNQSGKQLWVEKEYYWDSRKMDRQKTNSEYAEDVHNFLGDYAVRQVYVDPSAAAFKLELQRRGIHVVNAENDVEDGIQIITSQMKMGNLFVLDCCPNLIREIESYVWDERASERGWDEPIKRDDHAVDALRYAVATHKVSVYNPYGHNPGDYQRNRFRPTNPSM